MSDIPPYALYLANESLCCFCSPDAEITALQVQLAETQTRLQSERQRAQALQSQLAGREAELQALRAAKEALEEERHSARASAEREALSTGARGGGEEGGILVLLALLCSVCAVSRYICWVVLRCAE
jgi:hypothetical protein